MTTKKENGETSNRWYQKQEKKEEQVQNWPTQTLKSGGIGCKSKS